MANVKFGVRAAQYAVIESIDETTGIPTYGAWKTINCPVSASFEPKGEISEFYCGNGVGAKFKTNAGFEGTISGSDVTEDFKIDCLGMHKSTTGGLSITTADTGKNFAIRVDGDTRVDDSENKGVSYIYYNCTASLPTGEMSTTTDTTEGQETEITIMVSPLNTSPEKLVASEFMEGDGTDYTDAQTSVVFPDNINLPTVTPTP